MNSGQRVRRRAAVQGGGDHHRAGHRGEPAADGEGQDRGADRRRDDGEAPVTEQGALLGSGMGGGVETAAGSGAGVDEFGSGVFADVDMAILPLGCGRPLVQSWEGLGGSDAERRRMRDALAPVGAWRGR
jgi:hypothetical protein